MKKIISIPAKSSTGNVHFYVDTEAWENKPITLLEKMEFLTAEKDTQNISHLLDL